MANRFCADRAVLLCKGSLVLCTSAKVFIVQQPPPVTTVMKQCDDDYDGVFAFDTSTVEAEILNGQSLVDVSVEYFDSVGTIS